MLPALLTGAISTLPAWLVTRGGIGVVYIVFHPADRTDSSVFSTWVLAVGATLFHLYPARLVQPADRPAWQRILLRPRGGMPGTGLVLTVICAGTILALAVTVLCSLAPFT